MTIRINLTPDMDSDNSKKEVFIQVINLLSKTIVLDSGIKASHSQRVGILAHALATVIPGTEPCHLYLAGLLHDIGGTGMKDHVLHHIMQGFQDMEAREHPNRGSAILSSFRPFSILSEWVRDHHEHYNGSGFPAAKAKQDITTEAGILHLADMLDVFIRTNTNLTPDKVCEFIAQQSGQAISSTIAKAGIRLFTRDTASMELLADPVPQTITCQDLTQNLPGFQNFSYFELFYQLLWLIAHVADTKYQGRQNHSIQVAFYSYHIAKALGHEKLDPMETLQSALLHNIGLTAVPWADLQLDYNIRANHSLPYRQHPRIATDLIAGIPGLSHLTPTIAAHHEHYNGTGFPAGLKGEEIPLAAQVIAMADAYQWLAGNSPHRDEHHYQAIDYIEKGKGKLFNPTLVDTAITILDNYGQQDISWLHDLPNVYAFFHSMRPGSNPPGQSLISGDTANDSNQFLFPRQWQVARLSDDLHFLSGADDFAKLTTIANCLSLEESLHPASFTELQKTIHTLTVERALTMTLRSKNNTALELIFTKQKNGYDLLSRGVNTAPIFQQTNSVYYRNFENNPEAELLLDHHAQIKECNNAFIEHFQIPKNVLLHSTITQLFEPFISPEMFLALQLFFRADDAETWSNEFVFITGTGGHLVIQATLYRIDGREHDQPTYLCRAIDISKRKSAENELVRRDNELQAIVHNTAGMTGEVFFKALLYQFIMLTGARIGMISELTDNDQSLRPCVLWEKNKFCSPPDKLELKTAPCQLVVERGETYFSSKLHERFPSYSLLQNKNISSYWGLPLRRQDGVIIGILSIYDDKTILYSMNMQAITRIFQARIASELARLQTDRILLEKDRQLEEQNHALTRMNQLKSDMIAITSHDLKAPLSAIIGYASLLEEYSATLDKEKTAHYIQRIQKEGQKQLNFINRLLDLYRIESGAIQLTLEPHRLDTLLIGCLSTLRELARSREITFRYTSEGQAAPLIVDYLRIGQVLNNLLSNAIKFSPDQSEISVNYTQNQHHVIIQISDQGPGINEQEIDHIFDRYYMGRTEFKIRPEGAGLGLYIVHNIIELHGGTVTARNNSDGGSCFTVNLPTTLQQVQPS